MASRKARRRGRGGLPPGAHRVRLEVKPRKKAGDWMVTRREQPGTAAVLEATTPRKGDALGFAVEVARAIMAEGGFASVRIHGKDGRFQDERTFPRSSDPCPPRG